MKKKILILFKLALVSNLALAQNQEIQPEWVVQKDGHGAWDNTNDLEVTASGDVYITGYSQTQDNSNYDAITTKYNSQGVEQWAAELNVGQYTYMRALDVATDGSVVITGQAYYNNNGIQKMVTAKYGSTGILEWTAEFTGTGSYNYAYGMDVKVGPNGTITAFGYGYDNGQWGHFIVQYSSNGTELWKQFSPYNNTYFQKMGIDASGNSYLIGYQYNYNGNYNYYNTNDVIVKKFDASGNIAWTQVYDNGANEYATDAKVMANGDVYVAAYQYGYNNGYTYNFLTLKFDANGSVVWAKSQNFNQDYSYPQAIDVSLNGNVAVVGYVSSSNGTYGFNTVTYDANGNDLWTATSGANLNYEYAMDVAMSNSGDVFVTGYSYSNDWQSQVAKTVRYNGATGVEVWHAKYGDQSPNNNSNYHYAYGQYIDVDANENAYVAMYDYSYDYNTNQYRADYTTVKYGGSVSVEPLVLVEAAGTNVTCNGGNDGSIAVNFTGGKAPFTYTVNGQASSEQITGLAAGSYVVSVSDESGQTIEATVVITEPAPFAAAQNLTVSLDQSGAASITASQVDNGSSTACGLTLTVSPSSFDCSNVGENTVTLTSTGANGSVATATAIVTVIDAVAPVAIAQNVTVQLDASGTASITAAQIDNGSNDACGVTLSVSPSTFNCSNVGSNPVVLTVTDASGNVSTATATVLVIDAVAPIAICKNATVTIANGTASITAAQIDNGSNDACGIATLTVSPSTFNCSNIGNNAVVLTVTDVNGNVSTCQANVTVEGVVPSCSIALSKSDNTYTGGVMTDLYLGYGSSTLTLTASGNGGGPFTYSWSGQNLSTKNGNVTTFAPTSSGLYTLTCTTTNSYGCQSTCSVVICVKDIRVPNQAGKVYLCHVPAGNTANVQTLAISTNAVSAHLTGHAGDKLGACDQTCGTDKSAENIGDMYSGITAGGDVDLIVYPNPSSGSFNFTIESESDELVSIKIYDLTGSVVFHKINLSANEVVTLGNEFSVGMFMAEVSQGEFTKVIKLTKVHY